MEIQDKHSSDQLEHKHRWRPLWQRIAYPFAGIILIILGIIGWLLPIVPGFPLILIGVPLVACFHPKLEHAVRAKMRTIGQAIKRRFKKTADSGK